MQAWCCGLSLIDGDRDFLFYERKYGEENANRLLLDAVVSVDDFIFRMMNQAIIDDGYEVA